MEDEEESGSTSDNSWRNWVYASYTLSIGVFLFVMQQLGSEVNRLEGRITGTEVRMQQEMSAAENRAREDRKELRAAVDSLKSEVTDILYLVGTGKKR